MHKPPGNCQQSRPTCQWKVRRTQTQNTGKNKSDFCRTTVVAATLSPSGTKLLEPNTIRSPLCQRTVVKSQQGDLQLNMKYHWPQYKHTYKGGVPRQKRSTSVALSYTNPEETKIDFHFYGC